MAYPYTAPGVSINELVSPTFNPLPANQTVIAIVGESRGVVDYSEAFLLQDNLTVELSQTGVDTDTLVVKDAFNPLVTFTSTDYTFTTTPATGKTTLKRNLYTTISNVETVVGVASTTSPSGVISNIFTLTGAAASASQTPSNNGTVSSVVLQSRGVCSPSRDYDKVVTSNTATVARRSSGSEIVSGQTVYVSYQTAVGDYVGEVKVLTGTTPAALTHQADAVVSNSIVVFNVDPSLYSDITSSSNTMKTYISGSTADYTVSTLPAANYTVTRSTSGPTTMNVADNKQQVKVSYQATPLDYYQPTQCFSAAEVESRFGSAINSSGEIQSAVTFASLVAFLNGASSVIVQALFRESGTTRLAPDFASSSNYISAWDSTLVALRDLDQVNVIVPVFNLNNIDLSDANVLAIFQKVQSHINYMNFQNQYVIGIYGEDSTTGSLASGTTLRSHSQSISNGLLPERQVFLAPGSFGFPNPFGGTPIKIGGQFAAAAAAGMLAARPVHIPLTRKSLTGFVDVYDFRSEFDKNQDAANGITVIEKNRGSVRIRHSITTAANDANTREVSVIRAKHFMLETIRRTVDEQLIGQIIADAKAPGIVAFTIQSVLEELLQAGNIVGYAGLNARSLAPAQPTVVEVRFSYKPAYPLNYVQVVFSLDTSSGSISTLTSA